MIFVTVGSSEPFDRLVRAFAGAELDEELVVQRGRSAVDVDGAACVDYLAFDEVIAYIRTARIVICHAGAGTILSCLANGKRPVVVPRRKRYGEAIDDHQVELARRLARDGLVVLVEEPADVLSRLGEPGAPPRDVGPDAELVAELRRFLLAHV